MNRRAFTLIELLVVIAIVALVLGILLPALGSARSAGMSALCLSNTRQLQLASSVYAADHQGHYAPGAADFRANLSRWHGSRANTSEKFSPEHAPLTPYMGENPGTSAALRACPTFARQIAADDGRAPAATGAFEASAGGYGYNNAFVGSLRGRAHIDDTEVWRVVTDRTGAPEHLFARPSETMAFADAAFPSARAAAGLIEYSFLEPRFEPASPGAHRMDPSAHFRHEGRASFAHLDGHAESREMTHSWSSGLSRATPESARLGWPGHHDSNRGYSYR